MPRSAQLCLLDPSLSPATTLAAQYPHSNTPLIFIGLLLSARLNFQTPPDSYFRSQTFMATRPLNPRPLRPSLLGGSATTSKDSGSGRRRPPAVRFQPYDPSMRMRGREGAFRVLHRARTSLCDPR